MLEADLNTICVATGPSLSKEAQVGFIAARIREILIALGLDVDETSLRETPRRVAEMYVYELFRGLDENEFPELAYFEDPCVAGEGQVVRIDQIEVCSTCEHHLMPVLGKAEVAYIPRDKLLGLSKIHRIVDFYARRPQLQERLTVQIADCLSALLETEDVSVQITAWHGCVSCRGVSHRESTTTTSVKRGSFAGAKPF